MGKSIRAPSGAHELGPVSLSELIHQRGQTKLRTIDGWQKIGAVLNQHTAVAA